MNNNNKPPAKKLTRYRLEISTPKFQGARVQANQRTAALLHLALMQSDQFTVRVFDTVEPDNMTDDESRPDIFNQTYEKVGGLWEAQYLNYKPALTIACNAALQAAEREVSPLEFMAMVVIVKFILPKFVYQPSVEAPTSEVEDEKILLSGESSDDPNFLVAFALAKKLGAKTSQEGTPTEPTNESP